MMIGLPTNVAIESIVRASVNRGFDMVVIEDCCASYPDDWHEPHLPGGSDQAAMI